jgi:glutaminase
LGGLHTLGDTRAPFSIQSVSRVFVYALLCDAFGHEKVLEVLGVWRGDRTE